MKRSRKAILNNLEKLIEKYGFDEVRLIVNRYFTLQRETAKSKKELESAEEEVAKLKQKLEE